MVRLGSFEYDVTIDNSRSLAALDAVERRASQFNAALARSLGASNLNINTSAAQQSLGAVTTKAQQARAAIERPITPRVDTRAAESQLAKFGQGLSQGLGIGGGAAIAVKGIEALKDAFTGSVGAGLAYNAQIETAGKTLQLFTGSAGKAQEALKILRTYADFTPFDTAEVIRGGQAFIGVVNGDIAAMEKLVRLSGQLAATNPDSSAGGGFEGAVRALREVLGGQTTSIADRFNIPLSTIQSLKDAGLSGVELAEALVKAAHGSEELVQALSTTATGQLSTFQSALANLGKTATEPLFAELTTSVKGLNSELVKNQAAWDQWAKDVGHALAYPIRQVGAIAEGVAFIGRNLPNAQTVPQPGTGQFGLFGPSSRSEARRESTSPPAPGSISATVPSDATPLARAAARSAEQLKADAERLAKDVKESQAEINRDALEKLGERRTAAQDAARDERERIADVRDADIAASNAKRDAALAALDREAQGLARARTLEDRERSDSQEATLRGLEAIHESNLKGLDEQLSAIQKRRDAAVAGIDAEITAVDRKRDSALRAIDEEARRESQRHDAALRNIDVERDRKLGIIDQQLAALDAQALADQRRQTDQSLARSLTDARRDLRNADTPEERARALRAIADAEAAIQRERLSRYREDERARLRAAADEIRLAADTAKRVETAKNQATTEGLSARQRLVNEQAQGETARLNAAKARIETQTKVELDAIKARVDAENVAYQQTVQAARDSFEQINRAVADRRQAEDDGLAERRKATQDAFAAEEAGIKSVADTQLRALAESTRNTITELDRQKKAWADWSRSVQKSITDAISAGDPSRLEQFRSSYGPFDPPGYRESVVTSTPTTSQKYGPQDVTNYLTRAGYTAGTDAFNRWYSYYFDMQALGYLPPEDMVVTGRALGGPVTAGRAYLLHKDELVMPQQPGSVLPADVSRNLLAVAAGQQVGGGSISSRNLALTVNVQATGADIGNPAAFANRIKTETVRAVVQLLDTVERNAPDPAPQTLAASA